MLLKILGIVWLIGSSLIWLKVIAIKKWISETDKTKLRKIFFRLNILISVWLLAASTDLPYGTAALVLSIAGLLGILKAAFFLTSKSSEKVIAWVSELKIWQLRLSAAIHIAIGLLIIFWSFSV